MSLRISVFSSKELQATIIAMKASPREIAKQIRRASKTVIQPIWQRAVSENVKERRESVVLSATARVTVSDQNVTLTSATIGRQLSGGAKPSELAHSTEFGADRDERRTHEATSSKGRQFVVRQRRTRAMFRRRNLKGYVVYPAAAEIIPRIASLWVQTVIRTFMESFEKAVK